MTTQARSSYLASWWNRSAPSTNPPIRGSRNGHSPVPCPDKPGAFCAARRRLRYPMTRPFRAQGCREGIRNVKRDHLREARFVPVRQVAAFVPALKPRLGLLRRQRRCPPSFPGNELAQARVVGRSWNPTVQWAVHGKIQERRACAGKHFVFGPRTVPVRSTREGSGAAEGPTSQPIPTRCEPGRFAVRSRA